MKNLSPTIPITALVAVLALALPAAAAARGAKPQQETAQGPGVSVTLDWVKRAAYDYGRTRVTIVRNGVTVLDHVRVDAICLADPHCRPDDNAQPLGAGAGGSSLTVRDLDGDGEPEVIVDLYTGGAHCCAYSRVYRYDATTATYTNVLQLWGDPGYRLEDLDGDGKLEFVTADDRFAYAFTDYAASGLPVEVLAYAGGTFTNVTRNYPALVSQDADRWLHTYARERRRHGPKDLKGIVAAYVADQYLLGNGAQGQALLRSALRRGDLAGFGGSAQGFVARLGRFLRHTGYVTA